MISVRRWHLLVVVLALVLGSAAVATAAAHRANPARDPQPVRSAHRYWAAGPSATYGSDYGGIGGVRPLRVAVPEGTYDAVVTVSFEYRTHGPGPFTMGLSARPAHPRPAGFSLPSSAWRPSTARFVLSALDGGRTYELSPFPNSTTRPHGENRIATRRVLMTVDLTPVPPAG